MAKLTEEQKEACRRVRKLVVKHGPTATSRIMTAAAEKIGEETRDGRPKTYWGSWCSTVGRGLEVPCHANALQVLRVLEVMPE